MTKLSDTTRNKLKTVSTATVATALFKRGLRIQCIQDVHPLHADQPTLVGEAFTLRYMPAREDLNKLDVFRDRSHPQRKAIEDFVTEEVRKGRGIFGLYPATDEQTLKDFAAWRKTTGR